MADPLGQPANPDGAVSLFDECQEIGHAASFFARQRIESSLHWCADRKKSQFRIAAIVDSG
jgi:hypothetical protein